jgi:hypothetical protein
MQQDVKLCDAGLSIKETIKNLTTLASTEQVAWLLCQRRWCRAMLIELDNRRVIEKRKKMAFKDWFDYFQDTEERKEEKETNMNDTNIVDNFKQQINQAKSDQEASVPPQEVQEDEISQPEEIWGEAEEEKKEESTLPM